MKLRLVDSIDAEDLAMCQALYSRSKESVDKHLAQIRKQGSGKFMSRFYVGYGHESIGDCGFTAMFFEDVSLLVAKAIQNTPTYKGQECSTRYLSFSHDQSFDDFKCPPGGTELLRQCLRTYNKALQIMKNQLHDYDLGITEKEIDVRSFDVARGYLPPAVKTNLSLTASLRDMRDIASNLKNHPLAECREVGDRMLQLLQDRYPSSFKGSWDGDWPDSNAGTYNSVLARINAYPLDPDHAYNSFGNIPTERLVRAFRWKFVSNDGDRLCQTDSIDHLLNRRETQAINLRPKGCKMPNSLQRLGTVNMEFVLDFGSFRDLQRHRRSYIPMPLLTPEYGFHPWYLNNFHHDKQQLKHDLNKYVEELRAYKQANLIDDTYLQYFIPMGFLVPVIMHHDLVQHAYLMELRSGPTVHPTLRTIAQKMGDVFSLLLPEADNHTNYEEVDYFRRSLQDIKEK